MFHLDDVLQLREHEQVCLIARRHVFTILSSLFFALVLIVVPFFAMYSLFNWGWPGIVIFLGLVLSGIVVAIRSLLLWDADVCIVTTSRIVDVDQRGLLTRRIAEVSLSSLQDVTWSRQGICEKVFRMGTVMITSPDVEICVARVSSPKNIVHLIQELRGNTAAVPPSPSVPIVTMKDSLDMKERNSASEVVLIPEKPLDERQQKIQVILHLLQGYSFDELGRIESVLRARQPASSDNDDAEDGEEAA